MLNTTLSANFRGPKDTPLLRIESISSLSIDGLFLYFNGDLSLAERLSDPLLLWSQFSGLHLQYLTDSFLTLSSSFLLSSNASLVSISGTDSLSVNKIEAVENSFTYLVQEEYPLILDSDAGSTSVSSSTFESLLAFPDIELL